MITFFVGQRGGDISPEMLLKAIADAGRYRFVISMIILPIQSV